MITIHYRPLANRRTYESICLPVPPRLTKSYAAVPRPDPLGDAVTRGPRMRAATTREIPIAVDATLPAITAALERLGEDLRALGLGGHALRARAIGLAVETVRDKLHAAEQRGSLVLAVEDALDV